MSNFNQKTVAISFFVFFACIAPAITFGAMYSKFTHYWIGPVEMIAATAWCRTLSNPKPNLALALTLGLALALSLSLALALALTLALTLTLTRPAHVASRGGEAAAGAAAQEPLP